jgi:hypothetical protein
MQMAFDALPEDAKQRVREAAARRSEEGGQMIGTKVFQFVVGLCIGVALLVLFVALLGVLVQPH